MSSYFDSLFDFTSAFCPLRCCVFPLHNVILLHIAFIQCVFSPKSHQLKMLHIADFTENFGVDSSLSGGSEGLCLLFLLKQELDIPLLPFRWATLKITGHFFYYVRGTSFFFSFFSLLLDCDSFPFLGETI